MRVVCPGWFGSAHQPITLKGSPLDDEVSHGICPECLATFYATPDRLLRDPEGASTAATAALTGHRRPPTARPRASAHDRCGRRASP